MLILANSAFVAPLGIWFMQGYFRSIPPQIEEAALIDGTGRLGALYRIVLPSAVPGLVTVSLISFVASWNEFILSRSCSLHPDKCAPFPSACTST